MIRESLPDLAKPLLANPELVDRVAEKAVRATTLLRNIARDYAPVVFANSLGAEDMVLTDLIARHALPIAIGTLQTGALHAETRFVEITVETDDVRLTVQGTTPTSALGRLLLVDSSRLLSRAEADLAKVIRVTTDAALQVTQYTN